MPHPPLYPRVHEARHRHARGRVRHRRARARLRRARRDRRAAKIYDDDDRVAHRRPVRVVGGQRPLLRAVPDDRARRRRARRSRSARAGSASSPRRSRTGTAAGRRRRGPGDTTPTNVAAIARAGPTIGRAPARGQDPGAARTRTVTFNVEHAYGDWRATRSPTSSGSRTPAPTRSCA